VRDVDAVICRRFVWFRPAVVVVVDFLTEHVQAVDLAALSAVRQRFEPWLSDLTS
jgi:hypothetical protein